MARLESRHNVVIKGIGVSPGIVSGRAYLLDDMDVPVPYLHLHSASHIADEIKRFKKAIGEAKTELLDIRKAMSEEKGLEPLFIIDAHIMMLKDASLIQSTIENIESRKINAEWALMLTIEKYRKAFSKIEDLYLKQRISDVEYVGQRILRSLSETKREPITEIKGDVIIIARDLSPADTVQMKIGRVLGFATEIGGKTSHTAIVARSIGIPAVVGLERITHEIHNDDYIIVDGCDGIVLINPDPEIIKRYEDKSRHFRELEEDLLKEASQPAITLDGRRIDISANVEFIEEIPSALIHGAEGVGLYRTEFLYINKERLPTEREHYNNYKHLLEGKGLAWSTIRTFDLGGDKFISDPRLAKELTKETNPVMGLRAIRFCLQEIELFKIQLRAILRASVHGKTRILFPMISCLEEILEAKRVLEEVKRELTLEHIPFAADIEIGIMIEVPSAVLIADRLAQEVDFFSIGTNDLIQYALAIDRVNERVTYLYEPLHPAVLRLIKMIVTAAHKAGIRVSMCGEMAGEPAYTLILVGLELDELSMNPMAIPRVKKIIRRAKSTESKALVKKIMTLSCAADIEEYVKKYMVRRFPDVFAKEEDQNCSIS